MMISMRERQGVKMKIIQQNIRFNNEEEKKKELFKNLINEKPDVLFLSEFIYENDYNLLVESIEESIENTTYKIIFPWDFNKKENKGCQICVAVVFGEYSDRAERIERKNFPLTLRYITLVLQNKELFFVHAPQCVIPQCVIKKGVKHALNYAQDRVEQKADVFVDLIDFVENKKNNFWIGGDMNVDINVEGQEDRCIKLFKLLYSKVKDTEENAEKTWENRGKTKRFDYALTAKDEITMNTIVKKTTDSDHCALITNWIG